MDIVKKEYSSLSELVVLDVAAEYVVYHDGIKFEFYYKPNNDSDILYVFSPGYLNRELYSHPYYQRIKWFDVIERKGLVLSDPTLNLSGTMGIAWMQGTLKNFYLEKYAEVIKCLSMKIGVIEDKTMFYGSSAGGFASLMFLTYFPSSFAVVNNPQTNIFNFEEKHVRKLLDVSFNSMSTNQAKSSLRSRFSVSDAYRDFNIIPRFIYVQNTSDIDHYKNHYLTFVGGLNDIFSGYKEYKLIDNIFVFYQDPISKHNPAVYGFIRRYFEMAEMLFIPIKGEI